MALLDYFRKKTNEIKFTKDDFIELSKEVKAAEMLIEKKPKDYNNFFFSDGFEGQSWCIYNLGLTWYGGISNYGVKNGKAQSWNYGHPPKDLVQVGPDEAKELTEQWKIMNKLKEEIFTLEFVEYKEGESRAIQIHEIYNWQFYIDDSAEIEQMFKDIRSAGFSEKGKWFNYDGHYNYSDRPFMNKKIWNKKETLPPIYLDKKSRLLGVDDVISNGHIVYRVTNYSITGLELLSCTHGYKHNADQEFLKEYNRIGDFENLRELFECD